MGLQTRTIAARMVVIPLTEDATVVVLVERDQAVSPVRSS
jgi:hypothetical protein